MNNNYNENNYYYCYKRKGARSKAGESCKNYDKRGLNCGVDVKVVPGGNYEEGSDEVDEWINNQNELPWFHYRYDHHW